ncbi:hypothetical protein GWI34_22070 [Actinomadura sp. DSM 109109]|nr:hypothetical protein [Actinomadura lepetitiana]
MTLHCRCLLVRPVVFDGQAVAHVAVAAMRPPTGPR